MEVNVYNIKGEDTGRKITLNESIFGIEPNDHAIYLDVNFHYFSIITIEPLQPGTEPLIKRRLCSAITFNTCRF